MTSVKENFLLVGAGDLRKSEVRTLTTLIDSDKVDLEMLAKKAADYLIACGDVMHEANLDKIYCMGVTMRACFSKYKQAEKCRFLNLVKSHITKDTPATFAWICGLEGKDYVKDVWSVIEILSPETEFIKSIKDEREAQGLTFCAEFAIKGAVLPNDVIDEIAKLEEAKKIAPDLAAYLRLAAQLTEGHPDMNVFAMLRDNSQKGPTFKVGMLGY